MKKKIVLEKGDIGGTLDIGAGENPIPQARVATDLYTPTRPKKIPFNRKIKVIVDKTAGPAIGSPLRLTKSHKLRVFWAGNAKDLPDQWEGKFDKVYSQSSVGIYRALSTPRMGKELASMLKQGGKVEIVANSGYAKGEEEKHINKVVTMLEAGGFGKIEVIKKGAGNFTFKADKLTKNPTRKSLRISPHPKPPRPKKAKPIKLGKMRSVKAGSHIGFTRRKATRLR